MTMTRFFTNYVYTPITMRLARGASRRGSGTAARVVVVLCLPIVVTFLLVGLWHGAGWGFVVWGAIQGVALAVNLVWRELRVKLKLPAIPGPVGWLLMLLTFVMSLVYFRAPTVSVANHMLLAMVGAGPAGAPDVGTMFGTASLFGVTTYVPALFWIVLLLAVALLFPSNTQQVLERYEVALPTLPSAEQWTWLRLRWQPNLRWALAIGVLVGLALVYAGGPSPFLYYRF
jgi:D-alanyl-lipoteichoic acid acyltransferase DltB (MBOAT superfamily)